MLVFNSLTRKKEEFVPINPGHVGMYSCGPTVYDYVSIGNFRTYTTADLILRTLRLRGFDVNYVMNITDVGHLTGDNLGDADLGEDRMEKAAAREGKTAWDIAKFYTETFLKDSEKLNLHKPDVLSKATDHIKEQIELIKNIEEKGFAYKIADGIYFDTQGFEDKTGKKYGELSDLDQIIEGARVEINTEKKNPRDFALWKFSYPEKKFLDQAQGDKNSKRQMEWESPWGVGFPGWHIECSAMSMKYLGESFDIHLGGEDLKQTHHPNEIAQSEAATGKLFVKYWVHVTFLKVDGKRMGKSLGNAYRVDDIEKKGFDPLALRYFYLTAHYRDSLNFTWDALRSSQKALDNLRNIILEVKSSKKRPSLSPEKLHKVDDFRNSFIHSLEDDINTPQALATLWNMLKSNIPSEDKYDTALYFDEVLGLNLAGIKQLVKKEIKTPSGDVIITPVNLSTATISRIEERNVLRAHGKFGEADQKRIEINRVDNIAVQDTAMGTVVSPLKK